MTPSYAATKEITETSLQVNDVDTMLGVSSFLFIALFVFLGIYFTSPAAAVPSTAPAAEFSSGRAMKHLHAIAQTPRPIGSDAHADTRDYIVKELAAMELSPEVQKTTVINRNSVVPLPAATVENIAARLKGINNTKAVMLVGHYDSVPNGPGASDDGSAVAVLLEALRALKAGQPLNNDVICLFTDAEEVGLLGAKAFVDEHSWFKDVGVVLNFEARGSGGPAIMFETSPSNGLMIAEFAKAAPHPIANSVAYEVYKLLPNDTDLTAFRRGELAGLNFAFIKDVTHYHTPTDNLENVDEGSVQHQGNYALALARQFGSLNLRDIRQSDAVYFDLYGAKLIHYSVTWVMQLTILAVVLFVAVVLVGLKKNHLTLSGIALGNLAFLLSLIVAPLVIVLVWWIINRVKGDYVLVPNGGSYRDSLFMISFVALTVALVSTFYSLFQRKITTLNLWVGGMFWWLILLCITSLYMPGASYVFAWPLIFSLVGLGIIFLSKDQRFTSLKNFGVLSLSGLPALILLPSLIYMVFVALTISSSATVMVLVILLLGLLSPHLTLMAAPKTFALPIASTLVGAGLILICIASSTFDARHPRPYNLFYGLSADSAKASWFSADSNTNEWTSKFVSLNAERGKLDDYFPASSRLFLKGDAPTVQMPAPGIDLLEDKTINDIRRLRLRMTSPRQAPILSFYINSDSELLGFSVNGKQTSYANSPRQIKPSTPWGVRYYAIPKEGVEVILELKATQPVRIRLVDQSYGLPELADLTYGERPDYMMPGLLQYSDSTMVSRSFSF